MLEAEHLFCGSDSEGLHNNRYHVNEMVGLLGEPPQSFLHRSPHASRLFDDTGRLSPTECSGCARDQGANHHISDQGSGVQAHLLLLCPWKADPNTLQWPAEQKSLTFYNLCFAGYPKKEKAQENFSSIPGYQRIDNKKHYYIAAFGGRFCFTPLPLLFPTLEPQKWRNVSDHIAGKASRNSPNVSKAFGRSPMADIMVTNSSTLLFSY